MRKTNTIMALFLILVATAAQAGGLGNQLTGPDSPLGENPGPYAKSFEVQGPSGGTQIRGYSDGFGGYYLTGPSGGPVGQIRGDGTLVGPSGGYEGRIDVR